MPEQFQIKSNKLYSLIANFYDTILWFTGYKFAVRYFIRLLPFKEQQTFKMLDAGCGTGLYSFAVLDKFPNAQITAFDLNPAMIERMKETLQRKRLENRVKVYLGDVTKPIPENQEQFDLIITGGVLEYVDVPTAVRNLTPYLKQGGYFLNSPVKDNLVGRTVAKLYGFTPHSREINVSSFTRNGFQLIKEVSLPIIKEAHLFKKI